jgi:hypothetical protein
MRRACIDEVRRFVATGDYDMVFPVWPGGHALERMHAGDAALRAALADALRQRTKGLTLPAIPEAFDVGQFVLGKVYPMVCGLFPAKERQVMLDLFERALVFVSGGNIEDLISETRSLSTAHQIANLFLGSLGLPGLDDQPVGFVGFSEETTFYVSMDYFKNGDPFADWVVHEAAHVFHNWKRAYVGLPRTRTRDFLLNISFVKREVFAFACEAYSRILERAKGPADRRRLYAEYVEKWVPHCDKADRAELVDALASAVEARNGWKRILAHCSPPRRPHMVSSTGRLNP